jgi:exodeoxyribonuclease VII small subunit
VSGTDASSSDGTSFEQAVAELEAIIARIESGEIGLETSIQEYERGVALVKRCREMLERVEQRVVDLTAQMQAGAAPKKA